jgi:hypothetical protein
MKKIKRFILMLLLVSAQSFAVGFSGGEQFSTQEISGRLTLQCNWPSGMSTVFTDCRAQILNPEEYAYLIGPQINADHISLRATREDGSLSKNKTAEYDGVNGKSKTPFNLWIKTLLQKPLLGLGKNVINYSFKKDNKALETGSFNVFVVDGGIAECTRMGFYYSNLESDCISPSNFCARYFSENNYCQQ